jgi:hypothetical protein
MAEKEFQVLFLPYAAFFIALCDAIVTRIAEVYSAILNVERKVWPPRLKIFKDNWLTITQYVHVYT